MTQPGPATIILAKGSHPGTCGSSQERCLFEWYNWLARQHHTDACPPGVSPVLHVFGMRLNDALPDDKRQQLRMYLPNGTSPLAGTAGDGLDEARGWLALDWLIRTYAPAWLDLAGLTGEAAALRGLRRIADLVAAQQAGPVVRQCGKKAAAARDAAWDAAGDAARDAAWAAAGDAADAAWAAAWAAAWDAAWAAADAADAARAAAGDAAGDAADAARDAAWAAAGDAAGDVLAPTVAALQDSAIALYAAMIRPEPERGAA